MLVCPEGKGRQLGRNDWRMMLGVDRLTELRRRGKIQSQEELQR